MLLALLASLPGVSLAAQEVAGAAQDTSSPCPYDEVVEFELTADDEPLEGSGPARWIEHEVGFSGGLHVWAEAESGLDLSLRIEGDSFDSPREDQDAGGGTTPYLRLEVEAGEFVYVAVAAQAPGIAREVEVVHLHLVAVLETEATRSAARDAADDLAGAASLRSEGRSDEGRALLARTIDELRSQEGSQWSGVVADQMWALGSAAYEAGDLPSVRTAWGWAREHMERTLPADHHNLFVSRSNLATAMSQMGDLAGARALWEQVLESLERTRPVDHPDLLSSQLNLAATMKDAGDLEDARALLEAVHEACQRTLAAGDPIRLMARQNLAVIMMEVGELEPAHAHLEAVLEARERTLPEDHQDLLAARLNLATTMGETGDLRGARALEEAVVSELERTMPEDHPYLLAVRVNLAGTLHQMGDLEGACVLLEAVIAAYERSYPGDHRALLSARLSLVSALMVMGDLTSARAICEGVVEVYERTRSEGHPDLLMARQILATTMNHPSDLEAKRALCEGVLAARERSWPEDHPDLLLARENLAATMWEMGELEGALALQVSVLEAKERTLPEDDFRLLLARESLATMLAGTGDLDAARVQVTALISGMQRRTLFSAVLSPRETRGVIGASSAPLARALALGESGDRALGRALFELIETQRVAAIEGLRLDGAAATDSRVAGLRAAARRTSEQLNAVVLRGAKAGLESEVFDHAVRARDRALRELRAALVERGVRVGVIELAELAAALPETCAAVGFLRYDRLELDEVSGRNRSRGPHLLAHVAGPDGSLVRVELGEVGELAALIESWRPATRSSDLRGVPAGNTPAAPLDLDRGAGAALRRKLLDPILAAAGEGTETLFICPDELVYLVPLDALPLGDAHHDDRWVGDQVTIRVLGSFHELVAPRPAPDGEPRLLALGGATYDAASEPSETRSSSAAPAARSSEEGALPQRFSPLPQTALEVESVAALFERNIEREAVLLEGEGATKQALVAAIAGKRYVHLATHGWFAPETVRSILDADGSAPWAPSGAEQRVLGFAPLALCGLALSSANSPLDARGRRPGILTAEELARLSLEDCELAVLSACETNVGPRRAGQGIQSLQAALHSAGARWAITTLWKVDDVWARKLMELFYEHLWVEQLPMPAALWSAKQQLIAAGAPARAWAPWVLSGAVR